MRYCKVRNQDISNGPGFRVSLFTQGCHHHCHNCFNPETWKFDDGIEWNDDKKDKFIKLCDSKHIEGISILGGDPFCLLMRSHFDEKLDLYNLLKDFKEKYPEKTVWVWTGFTYEELFDNDVFNVDEVRKVLEYIDVLVDGLYDESQNVVNLKWRGSLNQRFIDVKESLSSKGLVLYNI